MSLSKNQQAFVQSIRKGEPIAKAYQQAYPLQTIGQEGALMKGTALLERPDIQLALGAPNKPVVTDEQVIEALRQVAMGTTQYPVYDKSGEESLQAPPLTARLRALELLGKHLQLFSPGNKTVDKEEGGFIDDIPSESEAL